MPGKVTDKHRRLAFQHAKKHVLDEMKEMFSDLISNEHHSVIRGSDGVDLNGEVQSFLEYFEDKVRRVARKSSWSVAKMVVPRKRRR